MTSEPEKEQFRLQKEILFTAIRERFQVLPTISALSATLLVVATFNSELIPTTDFVKIILAILLLIIPVSLFGYLWELKMAEDKAIKWFEQYGKLDKRNRFESILAYLGWFIFCILSLIIVSIIFLIFAKTL